MASVIVFDEEVDYSNLLKRILEREGHVVTTCSDPEEAVRLVRSHPPDLFVADVRCGKKESVELTERIKTLSNKLAVMTIRDHAPEISESLMEDDYLIKPVDIETIESKVREILGSKKESNK